jgi:diketogulonate reductase-like aldo/keto reductase
VFLATKISSGEAHGYSECHDLVRRQLRDLRTDYIDLCE